MPGERMYNTRPEFAGGTVIAWGDMLLDITATPLGGDAAKACRKIRNPDPEIKEQGRREMLAAIREATGQPLAQAFPTQYNRALRSDARPKISFYDDKSGANFTLTLGRRSA